MPEVWKSTFKVKMVESGEWDATTLIFLIYYFLIFKRGKNEERDMLSRKKRNGTKFPVPWDACRSAWRACLSPFTTD